MNYPSDSYVPKPTSRPMTAAEKVIFALTWPVVAPLLLVLFIAVLLTAFPVIHLAGSVPIDEGSNG